MAITITPAPVSNPGGVQFTYPLGMVDGRLGARYDSSLHQYTTAANKAAAVIIFGQPLSRNGVDRVRAFTAANGFCGFAAISDTFVPEFRTVVSEPRPGYPVDYAVNVLTEGTIWVLTTTAATQGGVVALLDAGASSVVASGTASSTPIRATFLESALANTMAPIKLLGLL